MPASASDDVGISITMPRGTRLKVTEDMAHQIEALARREVNGIKSLRVNVGGGNGPFGGSSSSAATVNIRLFNFAERRKHGYDGEDEVKNKMRRYFNSFPGTTLAFSSNNFGSGGGGGGVDVVIKSDDLNAARITANTIVALLQEKGIDYVTEPTSSLEDGLPQVDVVVDRQRMYDLGLNIYSIGNEIRANINGVTAGRFQTVGDEIDIITALDEKDRTRLGDLESIFVNSAAGQRVPLSNFAAYQENTSPVSISRENQSRVVHVTGTPKKGVSINKVQDEVERLIAQNIPHNDAVRITYEGDQADLIEGLINFAIIIVMAIVLVFAVMASQFESFKDPFIVLFCIPLSFIGIVALYLITGKTLSVITAVGLLILVGIIVNNGIVLVDYTNLLRKRGLALNEACEEAAKNRLRPILMTTLTTILGLVPMAFFPGEGSESTQPIGQTILGGLTFGTLMTLFLMPALYAIFNKKSERRRLAKAQAETSLWSKKQGGVK
jgi:HAE1 family hydrophobic/amphiphilic exporter-1